MKKLLQIMVLSLLSIMLFATGAFASELMDFTGFTDKSKVQGKLFSTKYVLPANNWMTCEYKIKPILMSGYEWSGNKQQISASVKTFDKDGTAINSYYSKVTDFNAWADIKIDTRKACADESFDRYVGLGASFPYLKLNGNRAKVVKYEFSGTKGNYNGDAYDAICTCYGEAGPAIVVLYKDVRIDTSHKCTYLNPKNYVAEDCAFENDKYYAIRLSANDIVNSNGEIQFGYSDIGWYDKDYKTYYNESDNDGYLCTHLGYVQSATLASGTYEMQSATNDGQVNSYLEYYTEEDADREPCYDEYSIIQKKLKDVAYSRIGIVKPTKVMKDGKAVSVTYQYDSTPGKFKDFDYDFQFLYKDGDKIFARVLFKNLYGCK